MEGKAGRKQKLDFYDILSVNKKSTPVEIKTSYKKLALQFHPDKNGNSEEATEKFKQIAEAYSILSNPERKSHYDKYGTVCDTDEQESAFFQEFESMFFGGGFSFGGMDDDMDEFSDFLETDSKFMKKMMREMGSNYRVRGKRRKQPKGTVAGGMGGGMGGMDDFVSFLMNPGMGMSMGMGMSFPTTNKKKSQNKKSKAKQEEAEDGGWETEEDEIDAEDGVKKGGEDDGWETESEEDEK